MDTQSSVKTEKKKGPFNNRQNSLATIGTAIGLLGLFFFPSKNSGGYVGASLLSPANYAQQDLGAFPVVVPTYKFGFAINSYEVAEHKIESGQTLGKLLSDYGISVVDIDKLAAKCEGVFNIKSEFRIGKAYTVLADPNSQVAQYIIFEPNVYEFVVFDLTGEMNVTKEKKEVSTERVAVKGTINSSLWDALTQNGVSFEAAAKMEDALQWTVDFSHTQKGDAFRMVYDQHFIEGQEVGAGQVYAACYTRNGKDAFAFWFENGEYKGYYDYEGRPIQSGFLKSPVKYSRISSSFNKKRFHPILKRVRPHLGTDYAAPHGTPIYSVGSGVVVEAAFTRGNGRYVKVKHDGVYQTQYLHMSRFAKGIRPGTQVAQGEVIGYVGSTGLATGPHVCFRFWKNGKQVNHLKENLPQAKPLPAEALSEFLIERDRLMKVLEELAQKQKSGDLASPANKTNNEASKDDVTP